MAGKSLPEFTIIIDSRENLHWDFKPEEKVSGRCRVSDVIVDTLDAGDYSIKGYEDLIRIEKKAGFREIFGNYTPKEHKDRFEREMERLRPIKYKYLIIEGNLSHDVLGLSVPQFTNFSSPPVHKVLDWIIELQQEYDIVPIFAGECGKRVARSIFENFARKYIR